MVARYKNKKNKISVKYDYKKYILQVLGELYRNISKLEWDNISCPSNEKSYPYYETFLIGDKRIYIRMVLYYCNNRAIRLSIQQHDGYNYVEQASLDENDYSPLNFIYWGLTDNKKKTNTQQKKDKQILINEIIQIIKLLNSMEDNKILYYRKLKIIHK